MNKQEIIKKLVDELNENRAIELTDDNPLFENSDIVDFIDNNWSEFTALFPKLDKVERFLTIDNSWNGNIYSCLSRLKNLKELCFYDSKLRETEEYIDEGLRKLPKIEKIWLVKSGLSKFPQTIVGFVLPKLKFLGIIGNNFYKQNFHFRLNKNCKDLITEISDFFGKKAGNLNFIKYNWGLYNSYTNILILKDDFINNHTNIKSLSVYVLNENKQEKYEIFKHFYDLFLELNKELNCFVTDKTDNLYVFFYSKNHYFEEIELTNLIEFYKSRVDKYKGFITEDLIKKLGGKRLLEEIKSTQQSDEKLIARNFYDKNDCIRSISIENFKIFEEQQTISDLDDVNIVIGKNAEGKTSLLQAIAASLIPKLSDDIKNHKSFININAFNNSENDYAKTKVVWNGGYFKKQRITERGIVLESDKELPISYLVLAYGENLYAKEKTVESYQDILKTGNYKSYHTEAIFNTTFDKMVNPLDLLYELSEGQIKETNSKYKSELREIAQIINGKLNKFLESSEAHQFTIEKDGAYYKFLDTAKKIFVDFEQISEGYRSYIILLSDIVFRILAARNDLLVNGFKIDDIFDKVKGTIIIDEFDKHMHPAWQRTFLKVLRKEFPLIQFFLSTHNIIALQSAETEKALIVNKKTIEPKIIHLGQSIEAIYNQFFEGNNIFGNETVDKFKEFKKRLNQIDLKEVEKDEELNRLRTELICNSSEMEIIIQGEIGQKRIQNEGTK